MRIASARVIFTYYTFEYYDVDNCYKKLILASTQLNTCAVYYCIRSEETGGSDQPSGRGTLVLNVHFG